MKNYTHDFKKLSSLLVVVMSTFALSACNSGSTSPSSTSSTTTPTTSGLVALGASTNGVSFNYSVAPATSNIWRGYTSGTSEAIQGIAVNSQSTIAAYAALAGTDRVLVASAKRGMWVTNYLPTNSVGEIAYAREAGAFIIPLASNSQIALVDDSGTLKVADVLVSGGSTTTFAAQLTMLREVDGDFVAQDSERNLYQSTNGINWTYLGQAAYSYTDIVFFNDTYYGLTGSANAPGTIYYANSPTALALDALPTVMVSVTAMNADAVTGRYYVADAGGVEVFNAAAAVNLADPFETLALPTDVAFTSTNVQQLAVVGDDVYATNALGGVGKAALIAVPGMARVTGPDRLLISRTIDDMLIFANGSYQIVTNPELEVSGSLVIVAPGSSIASKKPKIQILASGAGLATVNVQGNIQSGYYTVFNNGAIVSMAAGSNEWEASPAVLDDTDNTLITATQLVFSTKDGVAYFMQTNGTSVYVSSAVDGNWIVLPATAFDNGSNITISAENGIYYANTSAGVFRASSNPAEAENWALMSDTEIATTVGLPPGVNQVQFNTYNFNGVSYQFVTGSTQVNTNSGLQFAPVPNAELPSTYDADGSNVVYTGSKYVMVASGGSDLWWSDGLLVPATDWLIYPTSFNSAYSGVEAAVSFATNSRVFYSGAANSFVATANTADNNSIVVLCALSGNKCYSAAADAGDGVTMTTVTAPYGVSYLAQ